MMYLLDANVLIDAERDYYPMSRVPEFWDWLLHVAESGQVKIPIEVFEEVAHGTGDLCDWVKVHRTTLLWQMEATPDRVQQAI